MVPCSLGAAPGSVFNSCLTLPVVFTVFSVSMSTTIGAVLGFWVTSATISISESESGAALSASFVVAWFYWRERRLEAGSNRTAVSHEKKIPLQRGVG